jgi:hypothetical protein
MLPGALSGNVIPSCFSSHKLANHLINLFAFSVLRTLCHFLCYTQFQFTQWLVLSASTPLLAPSFRLDLPSLFARTTPRALSAHGQTHAELNLSFCALAFWLLA